MRILLVLGGVFALVVAVLFLRRREAQGLQPVGEIPEWSVPAVGDPKTSRNTVNGYCKKIAGYNGQGAAVIVKTYKAPPAVAGAISTGASAYVGQFCVAEKYAEKVVGAVIVTPAKKVWNAIF